MTLVLSYQNTGSPPPPSSPGFKSPQDDMVFKAIFDSLDWPPFLELDEPPKLLQSQSPAQPMVSSTLPVPVSSPSSPDVPLVPKEEEKRKASSFLDSEEVLDSPTKRLRTSISEEVTEPTIDEYLHTLSRKKRKRHKEERRKLLSLSLTKLRQIEDAELFLRRSVLINNVVNRLKDELRQDASQHRSGLLLSTEASDCW